MEVGKIRSLLQSEILVSGLKWWLGRWRDVDRFGRCLELKGVAVVAWEREGEGGIFGGSHRSDVG